MKRKLLVFLGVEATLCILVSILQFTSAIAFTGVLAFPFEQIGQSLRTLSLLGTVGNIAAIIIYAVICLSPLAYWFVRRKEPGAAESVLLLLSVFLFVCLYTMINPGKMAEHFGGFDVGMVKLTMGAMVYLILVFYLVLRILRGFSQEGKNLKYLRYILVALCVILVYSIFESGLTAVLEKLRSFNEGNTVTDFFGEPQRVFTASHFFILLQGLAAILPYVMELLIAFASLELISKLEENPYSEAVIVSARALGKICRITVIVVLAVQIGINCLQMLMGGLILSSNYTAIIPLQTVALALMAMLLAKFFERSKQLKDDNDSII